MTYDEAKRAARAGANATGYDHWVRKDAFGFGHGMLPEARNRYGRDLQCEVVYCDDLARCKPGHGPEASHAVAVADSRGTARPVRS